MDSRGGQNQGVLPMLACVSIRGLPLFARCAKRFTSCHRSSMGTQACTSKKNAALQKDGLTTQRTAKQSLLTSSKVVKNSWLRSSGGGICLLSFVPPLQGLIERSDRILRVHVPEFLTHPLPVLDPPFLLINIRTRTPFPHLNMTERMRCAKLLRPHHIHACHRKARGVLHLLTTTQAHHHPQSALSGRTESQLISATTRN